MAEDQIQIWCNTQVTPYFSHKKFLPFSLFNFSHFFYLTIEIENCFFQLLISTIESYCIISILEDLSVLSIIHVLVCYRFPTKLLDQMLSHLTPITSTCFLLVKQPKVYLGILQPKEKNPPPKDLSIQMLPQVVGYRNYDFFQFNSFGQ